MNRLVWQYRELQRLYRLMFPERSASLLVKTIGAFWLWRHGARREVKVKLWNTGDGWYSIDLAIPRKMIGLEAKGGYQKYYQGDVARDQALIDAGWEMLRVSEAEMKADPKACRKRLRNYLKG